MMASKFRLLVVAVLSLSAFAVTHDGPVEFAMQLGLPDGSVEKKTVEVEDEVTAKEAADAFDEVLDDEKPLLKDEMEDEEIELREASVELAKEEGGAKKVTVKKEAGAKKAEKVVWASEFEKDVTELVMGLSKSGFGATPMGSSVQKISELIEKDMMPKVWAAHKSNQLELARLAKELATCGSQKDLAVTTALRQKTSYQSSSKQHKTCRTAEASLYTENVNCHNTWKGKKQVKDLKCKIYSETSKRTGEQNANKQIVSKGGSESVEVYVTRISATICGKARTRGNGGHGQGGLLDQLLDAKGYCERATQDFNKWDKQCKDLDKRWHNKKSQCNNVQDQMDDASCKWAIDTKDACESYSECYTAKRGEYDHLEKEVKKEVTDRKAEWKGLKRMKCLINSFGDGKVAESEVKACKEKVVNTTFLNITYPKMKKEMDACAVPKLYPTTAEYKKAEFMPLPVFAKGKMQANECNGASEISTTPRSGSPSTCKCERVTLNGPYDAGAMVKCINCLDARRSTDKISCPYGTKLFSPRSRQDWDTFLKSAQPLRAPNWIIDVTRPQNGCGGCTRHTMTSETSQQASWKTQDNSPWWLRSSRYNEPNGDYHSNCFLDLWHNPKDSNSVTWNDGNCNYHAKSYYCQAQTIPMTPKAGSPSGCKCQKVELTGKYTAKLLLKCTNCLDVRRSGEKNSCPVGTKLFAPASREDWKTFVNSAKSLRHPHWIIDVTRPQNGCGGCTRHAMNSANGAQGTWKTADGAAWWLKSTRYNEPNGDYSANCYLDLWQQPANENSITWNDGRCNYHSKSYYCQRVKGAPMGAPKTTLPPWRR